MDACAGLAAEQDVAGDDDFLGGGGKAAQSEARRNLAFVHCRAVGHAVVLAVVENDEAEH